MSPSEKDADRLTRFCEWVGIGREQFLLAWTVNIAFMVGILVGGYL